MNDERTKAPFPPAEYVSGPKVRLARHILGCRRKGKPSCGGAFRCTKCGKLVGWCTGGCEGSVRDGWCEVCWERDEKRHAS
jgi:hypothetical protein